MRQSGISTMLHYPAHTGNGEKGQFRQRIRLELRGMSSALMLAQNGRIRSVRLVRVIPLPYVGLIMHMSLRGRHRRPATRMMHRQQRSSALVTAFHAYATYVIPRET